MKHFSESGNAMRAPATEANRSAIGEIMARSEDYSRDQRRDGIPAFGESEVHQQELQLRSMLARATLVVNKGQRYDCEDCGKRIPAKRIESCAPRVPKRCLKCQEGHEKHQSGLDTDSYR